MQARHALLPRGQVRGEGGVERCQVTPAPDAVEVTPLTRALPVEKVDRLAQAIDENVFGVEIGVIVTGVMNPGQRFPQHASETTALVQASAGQGLEIDAQVPGPS